MKKRILMILSICLLFFSITAVVIQAAGVIDEDKEERCFWYCHKKYADDIQFFYCYDGCMFGPN